MGNKGSHFAAQRPQLALVSPEHHTISKKDELRGKKLIPRESLLLRPIVGDFLDNYHGRNRHSILFLMEPTVRLSVNYTICMSN